MEMRLERMGAVGHTADVLEAQLREQKVPWLIPIRQWILTVGLQYGLTAEWRKGV
jgi:hypothetical protein